MDSSAHRNEAIGVGCSLSASERADLRWGLERVLLTHEREGDGGAGTSRARCSARCAICRS